MSLLQRLPASLLAVGLLPLALPVQAAEPTKYLLDDTSGVVRVDVRQTVASPLFRKDLDKLVQPLLKNEAAQKLLKSAGIDPLQDVDFVYVVFGLSCHRIDVKPNSSTSGAGEVLIIQGHFDRSKLQATLNQLATDRPKEIKVEKAANGIIYDVSEFVGRPMFVAAVDAKTVMVAPNKDQAEDALAKGAGLKKTQLKYKAMQVLLDQMDPKQAIAWAACGEMVSSSSTMFTVQNGQTIVKIEHHFLKDMGIDAVQGGVTLTDNAQVRTSLTAKDAATADGLRMTIGGGLDFAKVGLQQAADANKELAPFVEALKSVKVSVKDTTIVVEGQATGQTIVEAIKLGFTAARGTQPAPNP